MRDNARRDSVLSAVRAELMLAQLRLQLAQVRVANENHKVAAGVGDATAVAAAEADLRTMETRVARIQLDIAETQSSSVAPRDELTAPLVGGRDFVKERIELDLLAAQQRLSAAEQAVSNADARIRMGAASDLTRGDPLIDRARASADLAVLAERLSLRREFLDKGTSAEQIARRLEKTQLQQDMLVARQALDLASVRAETIERQAAVGAASDLDVMRAKIEVKERELELQQLAIHLQRLRPDA